MCLFCSKYKVDTVCVSGTKDTFMFVFAWSWFQRSSVFFLSWLTLALATWLQLASVVTQYLL